MNNQIDELTVCPGRSVPRCDWLLGLAVVLASLAPLFAAPPPGSAALGGRVLEDLTGNGISTDDGLIPGRIIRLFQDNGDQVFNAVSDPLVTTDTTRPDGTYKFRNLPAGAYFLQQELPLGWVQTAPAAHEHDEIVTPAQCGPTPKERNDTIATAIATGLSSAAPGIYRARGEIGDNNFQGLDVDLFKVQLNTGDLLQLDIDAAAFGSALDSVLRLFDATGLPLAADDDAIGGGVDSHLEFVARSAGTYYVGVSTTANVVYDPLIEGSGNFASASTRTPS